MKRLAAAMIAALLALSAAAPVGAAPADTTPADVGPTDVSVDDDTRSTVPADGEPAPPTTVVDDPSVDDGPGSTLDDVVDDLDQRQGSAASVRSSDIPLGSIVLAALVLVGVAIASFVLARRRPTGASPSDEPVSPPAVEQLVRPRADQPASVPRRTGDTATLDFLIGLGQALIDAGDAVSHVESTLRAVARVNGIDGLGVIVLPTALFISLPDDDDVLTEVGVAGRTALRLDQIDDLLTLVGAAERGTIAAAEGQRRLAEIRASPPPHGHNIAVLGYMCSTVGLAAVLRAPEFELVVAAVLGAIVGTFRLATRRLGPSYQPFIPLVAAAAVSTMVFGLGRVVDDLETFPLLVSPLITFLPGALLTIGVLELATGQNVSGISRLASGAMKLVLLSLGLVAGSELVGVPAGDLGSKLQGPVGALVPWVGVGVFGVGVVWFNGARSSARVWIVLVLYVAYAGQVIGGLFFGSALSSFFGALAMTPVAILAARQRSGPTPLVMFLPGFWILVPGALGLDGVTSIIGVGSGGGALVTTVTSMVGISLGILLGLLLAADDPERPWANTRT